ncbi:MAG: hypothetical protein WC389_13440, partial [Lutibacter sp.]
MFFKLLKLTSVLAIILITNISFAQEIHDDYQGTYSGKILNIKSEEERGVGWNDVKSVYKILEVKLLDGPQKGRVINFE